MLPFTPVGVSQTFKNELCVKLDVVMHLIQVEMELDVDTVDGGLTLFPFVSLLGRILLERERAELAEAKLALSTSSNVPDTGGTLLTRKRSSAVIRDARRAVLNMSLSTSNNSAVAPQLGHSPKNATSSASSFPTTAMSPKDSHRKEVAPWSPKTIEQWLNDMIQLHERYAQDRSHSSVQSVESFVNRDGLEYCLCAIFFHVTRYMNPPRCSFQSLRGFVLDTLLSSDKKRDAGGSSDSSNPGCPLTVTAADECSALYHAGKVIVASVEERDGRGGMCARHFLIGALRQGAEGLSVIRVVDLRTRALQYEVPLRAEEGCVNSLVACHCNDGKHAPSRILLVATADGGLRGYDLALNLRRKKLDIARPRGTTVTILGLLDSTFCLCGDSVGTMVIWNLQLLAALTYLPDSFVTSMDAVTRVAIPNMHRGSVTAYCSDAARQLLFTAGLDFKIVEYCLRTLTTLRTFSGHRQTILTMAYQATENVLISAGTEYQVYCWPLEMVDCFPQVLRNPVQRGTVCVRSIRGTSSAVALDAKGTFTVWDLRLYKWLGFIACDASVESVPSVTSATSNSSLGTSSSSSGVAWVSYFFDPTTQDILCHANRRLYRLKYTLNTSLRPAISAHDAAVARGVAFDYDGDTLISCGGTEIQLWNIETAQSRHQVKHATKCRIASMLLVRDEGVLVLGLDDGQMIFCLTTTFRRLAEYSTGSVDPIVDMVRLGAFGSCTLALRSSNGLVEVIALVTETNECSSLVIRRSGATALGALSGRFILCGERNCSVSVWRLRKKRNPNDFSYLDECYNDAVTDEDFAPRRVACDDIYTAGSFPQSESVTCVLGIPGGKLFVAGDSSGMIHVWAFHNLVAWPMAHFPCRRFGALLKSSRVISLCFLSLLGILYVGDDAGGVSAFDLALCIPTATAAECPITYPISFTTSDEDRDGNGDALHPYSGVTARPLIPPPGTVPLAFSDVHQLCGWDAHPESTVEQILVLQRPLVLVTVSGDSIMHMWYLGGSPIGCFVSPQNNLLKPPGWEPQVGVDRSERDSSSLRSSAVEEDLAVAAPLDVKAKSNYNTSHAAAPFSSLLSSHPRAKSPSNTTEAKPRRQLISFLTDFQFGGDDADGVPHVVEEETDSQSKASTSDVSAANKATGDNNVVAESPLAAAAQQSATRHYDDRYNDLPAPYGNAVVSNRKKTAYLLKGILSLRNTSIDGSAEGEGDGGRDVDGEEAPKLLRRVSEPQELLGTRGSLEKLVPTGELALSRAAPSGVAAVQAPNRLTTDAAGIPGRVPHGSLDRKPQRLAGLNPARLNHHNDEVLVLAQQQQQQQRLEGVREQDRPLDIPTFVSRSKLNDVEGRPSACLYAPGENVDRVTYGSTESFLQYCKQAMKGAQEAQAALRDRMNHRPRAMLMPPLPAAVASGHRKPHQAQHVRGGEASVVPNANVAAAISTRVLQPEVFPSSLRHHGSNSNGKARGESSSVEMSSNTIDPRRRGVEATPAIAGHQVDVPVLSSPVPFSSPVLLSVLSPSRLLESSSTKVFKTMGEETTKRYHKELYRPVEMPTLRRSGNTAFVQKASVVAPEWLRANDDDALMGTSTLVTRSLSHVGNNDDDTNHPESSDQTVISPAQKSLHPQNGNSRWAR